MEKLEKKENDKKKPRKKSKEKLTKKQIATKERKKEVKPPEKKVKPPEKKGKASKKKRRKLTKEEIQLRKKKRKRKTVADIIRFVIPLLLVGVLVFFFILKTSPHIVEGDSMLPTLKNKDRVIVRKTKKINRYDVITFKPPVKSDYQYVKRVIGMPGDLIWVAGGYLFLNQQTSLEPTELIFTNQLPDGTMKLNVSDQVLTELEGKERIPESYYFVLGDNRENSSDSREFGLVNDSLIEGVVSLRFAPLSRASWIK